METEGTDIVMVSVFFYCEIVLRKTNTVDNGS